MKKISILFAALAAAFAVSCNKENPIETPDTSAPAGMKQVTITASIEGADTKTSYAADGKFSWTKGDQISVMGTGYGFYTLTATSDGPTTTFTGYIPEGVELRQEAFYPADPGTNRTDGSYYFNIPQYKDLSASGSADLPMGAYSGTEKYEFKHITGAALLTFTNFPADVETAEISIVNARLKLTGTFNAYLSLGLWTWNSKADVAEEERTLIRKVPVVDGQAQIYMPYNGSLWWDYTSTINIKGFDAQGNEYVLLKDKTMKPDEASAVRGVVKKYTALVLPDYVPEADLTKVDWDAENVQVYDLPGKASSSRQALRQVKVVADKYYVYARLVASSEYLTATSSDYFGLFIYDVINGTGDGYYGWNNNAAGNSEYNGEHAGALNLSDYSVALTVNKTAVDVYTQVSGDEIVWMMAIPRSAHENLTSAGSAYFTFLTYAGWTPSGSVPEKYDPMLEVTLP